MRITLIMVLSGIAVFWILMYLLFGRNPEEKEEGLEVDGIVAMWRTKRLLGFIESLARRYRRFWGIYGDAGIVLGFAGMAFVFYMLFKTAMKTVTSRGAAAGVQLVIPGVTIPLWYGLIGLAVVLVVHELSHGVVARADGIPLKSVGLVLFLVLPGAFVEPDEDVINRAPLRKRLRVYGAGSMANIVTALIALLIINLAIAPLLQPNGVQVAGVIPGSPADGVLQKGDVIVSIDGHQITTVEGFMKFMNTTKPEQVITLQILRGGKETEVRIRLKEHPERPGKGYIGIYPAQSVKSKIGGESAVIPLFFTLYWIYVLNIGIGLMNLFPLVPLDGGKMLDDVVKEYLPDRIARPVRYATIGVALFLLALNLLPAFRNLLG